MLLVESYGQPLRNVHARTALINYSNGADLAKDISFRAIAGNHRAKAMNELIQELGEDNAKIIELRINKTAALVYANMSPSLARYMYP